MSDGEHRWKCPKCSRSFRIPAGKSAPEACPDCLRATAAEEVERLAKFAADEEADRVAMETFVKVEKPEPEVFKEAEQPAETIPARLPERDSEKFDSGIYQQWPGLLSSLCFALGILVIGISYFVCEITYRNYESGTLNFIAGESQAIRRMVAFFMVSAIFVMLMQSLQFSRISRELWQLRYEMAKRDHDSKNPQN